MHIRIRPSDPPYKEENFEKSTPVILYFKHVQTKLKQTKTVKVKRILPSKIAQVQLAGHFYQVR